MIIDKKIVTEEEIVLLCLKAFATNQEKILV